MEEVKEQEDLSHKAAIATKWSLFTEVLVKIVTPVTQIILARILAPEAFGVVATVTMVTSFADMISDSGFQKYLIQHSFVNEDVLYRSANVAFWSNLIISCILWIIIAVFSDSIAALVGNDGLGSVLTVACASLPITSFSSIQRALFQRKLDFKTLMPIRVTGSMIPLVVTLPLAISGADYWSLIVGTIVGNLYNAIALTILSTWKPKFEYSFILLKSMLSFCSWSLFEAISIWFTTWAGTFVVSGALNSYYLGLYKQPMTLVNSALSLITGATTPVLFSSLSKIQGDDREFKSFFLSFQFNVAMFVLPISVGIFCYKSFLTNLLLGPRWIESINMLGSWGLSSGIMIVFSHYCSEVFRAKGRPRVSLICQCIYMMVMIPLLYISARISFEYLIIVNSCVRVVGIIINQISMYIISKISIYDQMKELKAPIVASIVMGLVAYYFAKIAGSSIILNLLSIILCMFIYSSISWLFPSGKAFVIHLLRIVSSIIRIS